MKIAEDIVTGTEIVKLENGTTINRYSHVVKGAEIGENCMIGSFCYVGAKAKIGDKTRIQNHNSVWDGVDIGDNVFIAPGAGCFTNHRSPDDRFTRDGVFHADRTIVSTSATICANTIIVAPNSIGEKALVAAGSIVLRSVGHGERVKGIVK